MGIIDIQSPLSNNAEDSEYIEKYGLHKVDRLKFEEALNRLIKAADAWGEWRKGVLSEVDALNELIDAALNYGSVRLYICTKGVLPPNLG